MTNLFQRLRFVTQIDTLDPKIQNFRILTSYNERARIKYHYEDIWNQFFNPFIPGMLFKVNNSTRNVAILYIKAVVFKT